jgi:hypothetical protein
MTIERKSGQGKKESKQRDVTVQFMHEQVDLKINVIIEVLADFSYCFPNKIYSPCSPIQSFAAGSALPVIM